MRFEFCLGPPFTSYKINGCALNATAVKLVFKELQNKEQLANSEPFAVTNMPVHSINSEQSGCSE